MFRIVLNAEQAKVLEIADEPVEICDAEGKAIGKFIPPKLAEYFAECKRRARMPGPRYTSQQVQETLRILEDTWKQEGPFGVERAMQIVEELRKKRDAS
ncbi:MAG: hypothetical protein L0Y72_15710 [Gemmataceae bacterium]|nr:hypothetical protein [Gemmataceae bacterium]MCI0740493.1 hypothetical protein [Gemmataceae bacterium]